MKKIIHSKPFAAFLMSVCALLVIVGCGPTAQTQISTDAPNAIAPNVAAEYANQTAEAAQRQAASFNAQASATAQDLTATAYAPFAAGTQAAVDLQIQKMYGDATSTSAAATQTANAVQQAYYAQATTTSGVATQIAAVTQQAFMVQKDIDAKAAEEREFTNLFWAWAKVIIFITCIFAIVVAGLTSIRLLRNKPIERDEYGKTKPVIDIVNGRYIDLNASPNFVDQDMSLLKQMFIQYMQKQYGFVPSMPMITAERQDLVKEREQVIEIERIRRQRLPKALIDAQALKFLPDPNNTEEEIADMQAAGMLLPEWKIINSWNGQSRPLGLGPKGIIVAQAASPHLLTTGGTGSGKTAFMLRTQATISLAKGYQVINLGFSNSGFGVFSGHPNYYSVELNQSSDVIECLASVYRELKERKQIIGGESIEWEHWRNGEKPPRPFVDVLIDELGNLADDIYTSEETSKEGAVRTKTLWRWMSMIAKEGRKVGIRFIAALQDPTAKSVDLSFRRNCTLVSFQLGDASQSRSFIGAAGAELLQVGHFMTRNFSDNQGIVVGGGFAPNDDEIKGYLNQHTAAQTPAPGWIEGVVINQPALPKQESIKLSAPVRVMSKAEFVNGLHEWEVRVLDLHEARVDKTTILESVFTPPEYQIGRVAIDELIQRWQVVKGATPENFQPAPEPEETDEQKIRTLHEQGLSNTNIVYQLWGKSGSSFADNMAKVKNIITATAAPENAPESA